MASFVKNPLTSLLRSAGSAQAARCWCSKPSSIAIAGVGARRFLATVVDASEQQQQQQPQPVAEATTTSSSSTSAAASQSTTTTPPARPFANSPGRRAPLPVPAGRAEEAQQIYLPNIIFRLVRNSPKEAKNPFIATFRVPVQLTKPDIVSYLWQIYGLKVTSISTITEMGEMVRMRPGKYKAERRKKNTKKAIVGMEEPFWFPEKRPEAWLRDNFETEGRADSLTRRLMPVGDGGPGRGRRSFRWRGANATKQGVGARYSEIVKRLQERRTLQEQQVMSLVEKEKASMVKRLELLKAQ